MPSSCSHSCQNKCLICVPLSNGCCLMVWFHMIMSLLAGLCCVSEFRHATLENFFPVITINSSIAVPFHAAAAVIEFVLACLLIVGFVGNSTVFLYIYMAMVAAWAATLLGLGIAQMVGVLPDKQNLSRAKHITDFVIIVVIAVIYAYFAWVAVKLQSFVKNVRGDLGDEMKQFSEDLSHRNRTSKEFKFEGTRRMSHRMSELNARASMASTDISSFSPKSSFEKAEVPDHVLNMTDAGTRGSDSLSDLPEIVPDEGSPIEDSDYSKSQGEKSMSDWDSEERKSKSQQKLLRSVAYKLNDYSQESSQKKLSEKWQEDDAGKRKMKSSLSWNLKEDVSPKTKSHDHVTPSSERISAEKREQHEGDDTEDKDDAKAEEIETIEKALEDHEPSGKSVRIGESENQMPSQVLPQPLSEQDKENVTGSSLKGDKMRPLPKHMTDNENKRSEETTDGGEQKTHRASESVPSRESKVREQEVVTKWPWRERALAGPSLREDQSKESPEPPITASDVTTTRQPDPKTESLPDYGDADSTSPHPQQHHRKLPPIPSPPQRTIEREKKRPKRNQDVRQKRKRDTLPQGPKREEKKKYIQQKTPRHRKGSQLSQKNKQRDSTPHPPSTSSSSSSLFPLSSSSTSSSSSTDSKPQRFKKH